MAEGAPASEIAGRAAFDAIRYAQVWEDADVLVAGLDPKPGATLVSIASAGDNALALLTRDPAKVVAIDLSEAQLACLRLRLSAYRRLSHGELLALLGSRPSAERGRLLDAATEGLAEDDRRFWAAHRADVIAFGAGGVGRFEAYFRHFRRFVLPLTQGRRARDLLLSRDPAGRARFHDEVWDNWRWRLVMRLFFSRLMMGRLGRDPAFFDHVEGSAAEHVARRIRHAGIETDPSANPYLHWIITGTHGDALPLALRPEHFGTIRERLDRIEIRHGALEGFGADGEKADGYNLSDIFEYMAPATFHAVYARLLATANPSARLLYWNMMAPRRAADAFPAQVARLEALEDDLKRRDMAFFYSDLVIEEVRA